MLAEVFPVTFTGLHCGEETAGVYVGVNGGVPGDVHRAPLRRPNSQLLSESPHVFPVTFTGLHCGQRGPLRLGLGLGRVPGDVHRAPLRHAP